MKIHVPTVLDIARQHANERRQEALRDGNERMACFQQIQMDCLAKAKHAHVCLAAAAAAMIRIQRQQGVAGQEAKAAIDALDAALEACDPRVSRRAQVTGWVNGLAETSDDELRSIFASRPDLAARLSRVLQSATV